MEITYLVVLLYILNEAYKAPRMMFNKQKLFIIIYYYPTSSPSKLYQNILQISRTNNNKFFKLDKQRFPCC